MNNNPYIRNYQFGRFTIFLVIAACIWVLSQKPELMNLQESKSHEFRDQLKQKMDKLSLQYFIDTNIEGECTLVIMEDGEPQALTEYDSTSDLACKRILPYIKAPKSKDNAGSDIQIQNPS
ncbi:hypothetical protein [Litoribacillus peritrichatus]|uniref:Uncharacterized protein n=1 Tax=Litoribacillus peritrichatus TaxID=718191 RepID=A0ABP7MSG7_9GAMM